MQWVRVTSGETRKREDVRDGLKGKTSFPTIVITGIYKYIFTQQVHLSHICALKVLLSWSKDLKIQSYTCQVANASKLRLFKW